MSSLINLPAVSAHSINTNTHSYELCVCVCVCVCVRHMHTKWNDDDDDKITHSNRIRLRDDWLIHCICVRATRAPRDMSHITHTTDYTMTWWAHTAIEHEFDDWLIHCICVCHTHTTHTHAHKEMMNSHSNRIRVRDDWLKFGYISQTYITQNVEILNNTMRSSTMCVLVWWYLHNFDWNTQFVDLFRVMRNWRCDNLFDDTHNTHTQTKRVRATFAPSEPGTGCRRMRFEISIIVIGCWYKTHQKIRERIHIISKKVITARCAWNFLANSPLFWNAKREIPKAAQKKYGKSQRERERNVTHTKKERERERALCEHAVAHTEY